MPMCGGILHVSTSGRYINLLYKNLVYYMEDIMNTNSNKFKVIDMVYIAMMAVLIAICSWIYIPTAVPFTLQTFAVFCTVGLLGGKRGTIAVLIYILMGMVGIPVFQGFRGGIGELFGMTGGYIIGFLFLAILYWVITQFFGSKLIPMVIAMVAGLMVCYTFGTLWFMYVYGNSVKPIGIVAALSMCVFPFVLFDLLKIALAVIITKRLSKYVQR